MPDWIPRSLRPFRGRIRGGLLWVLLVAAGCGPQAGPPEPAPLPQEHEAPARSDAAPDLRIELEAQGRFVFERHCVPCHGRWGDGRGELSVGMEPRPSNFTRARFKFRSTPSGSLPTDDDLRRVITQGIAGSSMPAFAALRERDVTSVTAYLKTFSRRWDDPALRATPIPLPAAPSWISDPEARQRPALRGRALFRAHCAPCHGDEGRGDGPSAAALEDDGGRPSPPYDLTTGLWRSGPLPSDLLRTLTTGMDGTPMPAFGEALSVEEGWDLVGFLLTLPASARPDAR